MPIFDRKGVSALVLTLLILVSAILGGLAAYMFTIAAFIEIPKGTTVTITGVYFDKENASSFKVGVMNPSYSSGNATIVQLAITTPGTSEIYNISDTQPQTLNRLVIGKGESLNITCSEVLRDGADVTWGQIAGEFAGQSIMVHVFSIDAPAANMIATLPNVMLNVTKTYFDSKVSFKTFNITVTNPPESESNLTIKYLSVAGIELGKNDSTPKLPQPISIDESVTFMCNASWHGLINATITIFTEEGYLFLKSLGLPEAYASIQNVTFNEDYTDYFNVTVVNFAESANYVNVTKVVWTLENGTIEERDCSALGIMPNSTATFMLDWNWREYRGKSVDVTAYLLQDFETDTFTTASPSPIIIQVLNKETVFDLADQNHFSIELQNHQSSLQSVNIAKIVLKGIEGVPEITINGTQASPPLPIGPIDNGTSTGLISCNVTWTAWAGKNITLTVQAVTNETSEEYTSNFKFTLPTAELNITSVTGTSFGGTEYLEITVESWYYSVWNLTISKVTVEFGNQSLDQTFLQNQTIVKPSESAVLLCPFVWDAHVGESATITVVTVEGVEDSIQWVVHTP